MKRSRWILQWVVLSILGIVVWFGYGIFQSNLQESSRPSIESSQTAVVAIEKLTQQKLKCKAIFKSAHKQLQTINRVIRNNLSADKPKQASRNAQQMRSAFSQWSSMDRALTDCRAQFIALAKGYLVDTEYKVDAGVIVQSFETDFVVVPKQLPRYQSTQLDALLATLNKIVKGNITAGMFKLYDTQSRPVFSYFKARLVSEEKLEMSMDNAFKSLRSLGGTQ